MTAPRPRVAACRRSARRRSGRCRLSSPPSPSGCCRPGCGCSRSAGPACRWSSCGCGSRSPGTGTSHLARASVLADTLLSGTAVTTASSWPSELQSLGATFNASVDADRLSVGGVGPARPGCGAARAARRGADVRVVPDGRGRRRAGPAGRAAGDPALAAVGAGRRGAAARRLYGAPPVRAASCPTADDVQTVKAAQLRKLHGERVGPTGGVLVLSATCRPARALDAVETALGGWTGAPAGRRMPTLPPARPRPLLLVDRPGSVQSTIRLGGPACRGTRRTTRRCSWRTWSSAATSPRGWSRTSARTRATRTARTVGIEHPAAGSRLVDRHRRRDRGDGAGAAGDLVRAGPDGDAAGHARRSWTRPGSTRSARSRCPSPPRPAWPPRCLR